MFSFFKINERKEEEQNNNNNNNNTSLTSPSPNSSSSLSSSSNSISQQYKRAEELLKAAVFADSNKKLDDALFLYQESLNIWLEILNQTNEEIKKIQIADLISTYMTRAETIKQILENNHSSSSSSSSSSSPSTIRSNTNTTPGLTRKPSSSSSSSSSTTATTTTMTRGNNKTTTSSQQQDSKVDEHEAAILSEMLDSSPGVRWSDIIGLETAKQTIQEVVIYPYLRPDIFRGLRAPPKGVLLYGPPGTGKTMIAKAVATESGFRFFNISASSVMNKYMGEGEKLMKAVFSVAKKHQPSVIFFDEIDALLSARKESEHEASRRLKTEFMIQIDGAGSNSEDKILVIGATNLPWELDEAVLRRFVKRIYIPLPDPPARESLIRSLFLKQRQSLPSNSTTNNMITNLVRLTDGYSAADITALFQDAAMGPLREIPANRLPTIKVEEIRPINEQDFINSIRNFHPSVSHHSLEQFQKWQAGTR